MVDIRVALTQILFNSYFQFIRNSLWHSCWIYTNMRIKWPSWRIKLSFLWRQFWLNVRRLWLYSSENVANLAKAHVPFQMTSKISRKGAPQCHHSVLVLLSLVLCGICSKSRRPYIQMHFLRLHNPVPIFQITSGDVIISSQEK